MWFYYKILKKMSDTNSNMEKTTRTVKEILADIEEKNQELVLAQRAVKHLYKELDRSHKIEVKEASKRKKSSKNSGEKRDPSGFNAKQPVPVEFCEQPWGCTSDQELPRTMLTKMVYDYVKENGLQDPKDKRRIFPDETVKKLFHLNDSDELHFNNFQTYMKRLYDRSFEKEDDDASLSSVTSASDVSESEASDVEEVQTKSKSKSKGKKASKSKGSKSKGKRGKKSSTASQNL
jgi:upstream activation factor subunit UAF30